MSLITKQHLKLVLQSIKKLLSFKADKTEVVLKNEVATDEDIIKFVSEMGIADPVTTSDGSVYTNTNGDIYVL